MAVTYKDYYETLGVAKTATQDEIRKAFRTLARKFHPDVAKDKKAAEAKFKEINEANEVLSDPEKRKQYDELGANWANGGGHPGRSGGGGGGGMPGGFGQPGGGQFGGTGFSDFFEQFFSGRTARGGGGRTAANPFGGFGMDGDARGEDIEADLLVTVDEVFHGAKKKISFRRNEGASTETFEVKIPKGVKEGQRIRLAGQGNASARGRGTAGDLLLRVRFAKHPDYRVEGADLIHELEVPAWKAVLGGEVSVPTPEGAARLKISAGSQNGRRFRMKARGLPSGAAHRGDFYVEISVVLPAHVSDEERVHWEALSKL